MTDDPVEPHWDATKDSNVEAWEQKRRAAGAMRRVIDRLVQSDAPADELRAAAEGLERWAEALDRHPRLRRVHGHAEAANAGDVLAFFDQSPFIGLANPLAPPIVIGRTGEMSAVGVVTFGSAYEGPPGSVHGGYVAAAFDEVLGFVQSLGGAPGMTGTLEVRYLHPTPLGVELRIEAELVRTEGRKIFTEGRIRAGERETARAHGLFISVPRERLEAMMEKRNAKLAAEASGAGPPSSARKAPLDTDA